MESTIYKPGAYNSPGIYKGAGGVYNGRSVYNDGAGYNGPFVLLNNCDNIDEENVCKSYIGPDLFVNGNLPFGNLFNSSVFPGTRSIKRNNSNYVSINDIETSDIFTLELYFSSIPYVDVDFYAMQVFCGTANANGYIYIGGTGLYDFETSYPVINWTPIYKAIKINYVNNAHLAAVINKLEKKVYCFVNGLKIGAYKYTDLGKNISQNGEDASMCLEFFCVRNGDFSNNLNSFTIPTNKYNL